MTTPPPLDAAIFDLGGVVFQVSFGPVFASWASSAGLLPQTVEERYRFDHDYEAFERGDVSVEQYRSHVSDLLGATLSLEEFERGWNRIYLEVTPGIHSLLSKLRPRMHIVVLTNTNESHAGKWRGQYKEVIKLFEKVFASNEIRARKPEPDAFRIVLDYLGASANRVAFFDDKAENVEGARALGIRGFVADSVGDIMEGLRSTGFEIE